MEGIKQGKFKRGCLGCLGLFLVVFLFWFILVERHFIFIRYPIYGTITDRETGKPIENALVVFAWRSSNVGWREYDATITDEKGYYKLPKRKVKARPIGYAGGFFAPPIEKRDGCVLVTWFPGYFRSERWEKGKRLIKGRQDFALQKAKTREEVVRRLESEMEVSITFRGIFFKSGNGWRMYNPKAINPENVKIYYKKLYKEFRDKYNITGREVTTKLFELE